MDAVAERRLDLLRRDQVLIGHAVEQHLDALAAGAELADALDQPLRVADRRHVGIGHQEDRVGGIERRGHAGVDDVAAVDDDVVVGAREHAQELFDRAGVLRVGPVELLGGREDVEAGLVLGDQLLQEVLVEPVQVLDRVEHGEARPHAEKERHLAEAGFRSTITVGRLVRRASSTAQLTATVVVPAPPLAPRNACVTHGGLAPALAASRRAAVRRTAPWNDSSVARAAADPSTAFQGKNSLAPARIAWRISSGSGAAAMTKIARLALLGAEPLDRRHPRRGVGADVDDHQIRRRPFGAASLDDADRHAARAKQVRDLPFELVVVADDLGGELGH